MKLLSVGIEYLPRGTRPPGNPTYELTTSVVPRVGEHIVLDSSMHVIKHVLWLEPGAIHDMRIEVLQGRHDGGPWTA